MKSSFPFRLRLVVLTGIVRLLARLIRASGTPSLRSKPAPAPASGRVIEGEYRRIDSRYESC